MESLQVAVLEHLLRLIERRGRREGLRGWKEGDCRGRTQPVSTALDNSALPQTCKPHSAEQTPGSVPYCSIVNRARRQRLNNNTC